MTDKIYQIKKGARVTKAEAFQEADAVELRLLVALMESEEGKDLATLAREASLSEEETERALSFWRGAGAIKATSSKKNAKKPKTEEAAPKEKKSPVLPDEKMPTYSIGEMADKVKQEKLASFLSACEQVHGKVLNETDISILLWMHEELSLECDYILMLLAYCEEGGRKPLRYTQKVAASLFEQDITTTADLTAYIERKNKAASREGNLRKMFGIGERKLSAKEEDCFMRWCVEYNYGDDIIGLAYDITVNATGKASVAYADKIIQGWNAAGCKTVADAEKHHAESRPQKPLSSKKGAPSKEAQEETKAMQSFDADDFFAHALERSYIASEDKKN